MFKIPSGLNADAASQHTGIAAFTNSISARQRWSHIHFIPMTFITHLLEDVGQDDFAQELKDSHIEKKSQVFDELKATISESMNPFSLDLEKNYFYNIATGRAASKDTSDFLLNVTTVGLDAQATFIDDFRNDSYRFNNVVPRQKI